MPTIPEPDRARAAKNRRLIAERRGWPDGAVEACEAIEARHPDWSPGWRDAWMDQPAGYYAQRYGDSGPRYPQAYGTTPEALERAIEATPDSAWPW